MGMVLFFLFLFLYFFLFFIFWGDCDGQGSVDSK